MSPSIRGFPSVDCVCLLFSHLVKIPRPSPAAHPAPGYGAERSLPFGKGSEKQHQINAPHLPFQEQTHKTLHPQLLLPLELGQRPVRSFPGERGGFFRAGIPCLSTVLSMPHSAKGRGLLLDATGDQLGKLPGEMLLHPAYPSVPTPALSACREPGSWHLSTGNAESPG